MVENKGSRTRLSVFATGQQVRLSCSNYKTCQQCLRDSFMLMWINNLLNINIMTGIILYYMTGGLLPEEYTWSVISSSWNQQRIDEACDL